MTGLEIVSIASLCFLCFFCSALLGIFLRSRLPVAYVTDESKDVLKLGLGVIGTSAGLVLGLLVASASASYNTQRSNVVGLATQIAVLDRALAHYGPEASNVRASLRDGSVAMLARMWPGHGIPPQARPSTGGELVFDEIEELAPENDKQRSVKSTALTLALAVDQSRWQIYAQLLSSISVPLVVLLVIWFSLTFLGLGLVSPTNPVTIAALVLSAVSIGAGIFLMLALYSPFQGLLQLPSAPLEQVISSLGK